MQKNFSVIKPKFRAFCWRRKRLLKTLRQISAAKRSSAEEQITMKLKKLYYTGFGRRGTKTYSSQGQCYRKKNAPCHTEDLDGKFSKIKIIFPAKEHNLSSATTWPRYNTKIQTGVLKTALNSCAYMPTPPDYMGVSRIQSQSPTILYGWPKLPDKRKFGSVAH